MPHVMNKFIDQLGESTASRVGTQAYDIVDLESGRTMGRVTFPKDTDNANYGPVCFYDPATDSFRGNTIVNGYLLQKVEREPRLDREHGSPYDRGHADSYYRRSQNPHGYEGATGVSPLLTKLYPEEVEAYTQGYNDNEASGEFKDYGWGSHSY